MLARKSGQDSMLFACLIMAFGLLALVLVMNMLIGVLCEVVSIVSAVEKETLTVGYVRMRLLQMFEEGDADGSLSVSKDEFNELLVLPEAAKIIQEIGVDVIGLVDFADFIFKDGGELSFADFMELVLSFRGSNGSTVKDIVDLRKFVMTSLAEIKLDTVKAVEDVVGEVSNKLDLWKLEGVFSAKPTSGKTTKTIPSPVPTRSQSTGGSLALGSAKVRDGSMPLPGSMARYGDEDDELDEYDSRGGVPGQKGYRVT